MPLREEDAAGKHPPAKITGAKYQRSAPPAAGGAGGKVPQNKAITSYEVNEETVCFVQGKSLQRPPQEPGFQGNTGNAIKWVFNALGAKTNLV